MRGQRGYTLIELLVVIVIISVLMALLLGAVHQVRTVGPRTQQAVELSQIAVGLDTFEGQYGTFPALTGGGPNGEFRLCSDYRTASGRMANWPEAGFIANCWPHIDQADNGFRLNGAPVTLANPVLLDANQTAVLWLTGGSSCSYRGLSLNPRRPFEAPLPGDQRRSFISPRADQIVNDRIVDRWGTPLAFIVAKDPRPSSGVALYTDAQGFPVRNRVQVISAGPDRKFGPGGVWTPGSGFWGAGGPGADDQANFAQRMLGVEP